MLSSLATGLRRGLLTGARAFSSIAGALPHAPIQLPDRGETPPDSLLDDHPVPAEPVTAPPPAAPATPAPPPAAPATTAAAEPKAVGGRKTREPATPHHKYDHDDGKGYRYYPRDEAARSLTRDGGIDYRSGFPDFDRYSKDDVDIGVVHGDRRDQAAAKKAMKKRYGLRTQKEVTDLLAEQEIDLHHKPDTTIMQAVPRAIHRAAPHTGSAAQARAAGSEGPSGGGDGEA